MPKLPDEAALNARVPVDLLQKLDLEVQQVLEKNPGRNYTRSDLVREILYAHVKLSEQNGRKGKAKR